MAKKRIIKVSKITGVKKAPSKPSSASATPKNDKVQGQLDGARFRWLNESLYTEDSAKSFELFQKDPNLFNAYHSGFRSQTKSWPVNPVDECLAFVASKLSPGSVIGDFGCGDAKLAQILKDKMKVHSFDLVSTNPLVTACNIADVPLPDGTLDMAVFSLSLMGTDWPKFIAEALRCLKMGGILYVAEVQSRVTDFEKFKSGLQQAGDLVQCENLKDKYFVKVVVKKKTMKPLTLDAGLLKPCLYKKR